MPNVISVRFRDRGKSYDFDPAGLELREGDDVVVDTAKGPELGKCVSEIQDKPQEKLFAPLRSVLRLAGPDDLRTAEQNRAREKTAFAICEERIKAHGLEMKLVDVEYSFDGSKLLFFFTADGRVDFRELVKDLASTFHVRIELRQIGVRDGAKLLGGMGICGRPFCCSTFLEEFQPVSIRMAKTQSLSLNPTKISGTCGRLMCCLKYEQEAYEDLIRNTPKPDTPVDTPKGKGTIAEVSLLRRRVKVRLSEGPDTTSLQTWHLDQLGYTLNGEYKEPLPEEIPVPEESEVKVSGWLEEGKPLRLTVAEEGQEKKPGRNRNRSRRKGGQGPRPEGAQAAAPKERREAPRGDRQEKGDKPPRESRGEKNQQPRQKAQGGKPRENRPQEGQKKQPRPEAAAAHGGQDPQSAGKKPGKRPFYHNRKPKKPGGPGPQAQSK
jgi:cell fate regulator YaaT (PSP1 superfamily)